MSYAPLPGSDKEDSPAAPEPTAGPPVRAERAHARHPDTRAPSVSQQEQAAVSAGQPLVAMARSVERDDDASATTVAESSTSRSTAAAGQIPEANSEPTVGGTVAGAMLSPGKSNSAAQNNGSVEQLHQACESQDITPELLRAALEGSGEKTMLSQNEYGYTPLQSLCSNSAVTVGLLRAALEGSGKKATVAMAMAIEGVTVVVGPAVGVAVGAATVLILRHWWGRSPRL